MVKEIEIEFKNILNKAEFEELKASFKIKEIDFKRQDNDYFETSAFDLREQQSALRIRRKSGQFVLTLKQPGTVGLIETHQPLTDKEANNMIASGIVPDGEVIEALEAMELKGKRLFYLGRLSTDRAEIPYKSGTLTFDHSHYLNTDDFELEYEAKQFGPGERTFSELLRQFAIPKRPSRNKIQRFMDKKIKKF